MTLEKAKNNLLAIKTNIKDTCEKVNIKNDIKLIGVSKYSTYEDIKILYEIGQKDFGENKVQDLKHKIEKLSNLRDIKWHFIGRLQKNKINNLLDLNPTLIHSIDSFELAYEVNKKLVNKNKTQDCLLQINSSYEDSKAGITPEETIETYKKILNVCKNINLLGIMTIGTHSDNIDEIEKSFLTTKNLFNELKQYGAKHCSMGMSSDYELAIKHGSTMVRVGSKLFK